MGFATGTLNVSTTLVAQKIAELPNYRHRLPLGVLAVFYVVTCFWLVLRQEDPEESSAEPHV